ncbi:MAG TPA: hypothetical protein H9903_18755 [Candidatus Aquabacterium excrementipullorum]|nr:hypothetical protein [Candidatus Aquabacterium excrementipullorum]
MTLMLSACDTPASKRNADSEQCYRHGAMRTCINAQPATAAQIAAVHRMSLPSPGKGRLLIVRNDWADAYGHALVRLDGQVLIDTIPCSVFAVDVRPGVHRLQIDPGAFSTPLFVEVASGQLLVWQATRESTDKKRSFVMSPLDPGEARTLVQECRVLGLLDRTGHTAPPRD